MTINWFEVAVTLAAVVFAGLLVLAARGVVETARLPMLGGDDADL